MNDLRVVCRPVVFTFGLLLSATALAVDPPESPAAAGISQPPVGATLDELDPAPFEVVPSQEPTAPTQPPLLQRGPSFGNSPPSDRQVFSRVPIFETAVHPQGTLGATYSRRSHPVPADKHPRTGMLAVRDKGAVPHLSVSEMGGFRMKSGVWLFESTRPLEPWVCQIVCVEARQSEQDVEPYDRRFVRLIPGRIVYLDFRVPRSN